MSSYAYTPVDPSTLRVGDCFLPSQIGTDAPLSTAKPIRIEALEIDAVLVTVKYAVTSRVGHVRLAKRMWRRDFGQQALLVVE